LISAWCPVVGSSPDMRGVELTQDRGLEGIE
jgi:hypothetical protein